MSRRSEIEDVSTLQMTNKKNKRNSEDTSITPRNLKSLPKTLVRSEPKIETDTALLQSLIDGMSNITKIKDFERLDNLITRLRYRNLLRNIDPDLLQDLALRIKTIIEPTLRINYTTEYLEVCQEISPYLEPTKVYLNLAGSPYIDNKVLVDETIEIIMQIIRDSFEKLLIPLANLSNKQSAKLLADMKLQNCMANLCGILESLSGLITRGCLQDYWLMATTNILLKILFTQGLEMLQLSAAQTLSAIFGFYSKMRDQIIDEIIQNLPLMTADPNQAIGSKSKKLVSRDYPVYSDLSIRFCSFLVVHVLQSSCLLSKPIKPDGNLDCEVVLTQYEDTMKLVQYFCTNLAGKCLKSSGGSQDYRIFLEIFINDILKITYCPEFPLASKILGCIILHLFSMVSKGPSTGNLRYYAIERLSDIAKSFRSDIMQIRESPIVPHNIIPMPQTQHPSDNPNSSLCICKKGWSNSSCDMVQCESCWKWFHLDCVGLNLENYTEETWRCDDCRICECMQKFDWKRKTEKSNKKKKGNHRNYEKPASEESEPDTINPIAREIIYATEENEHIYKQLVYNFLISDNSYLKENARCVWLSLWIVKMIVDVDREEDLKEVMSLKEFKQYKKNWLNPPQVATGDFPKLSETGTLKVLKQFLLCFEIGATYTHVQNQIVNLLGASQPLTRSRALKGLAGIVEADPECLAERVIEEAVTDRLLDTSIAVREAACDIIGRFICHNSQFSSLYYQALLERLKDKGASVRKRVIKILKDIIVSNPDHEKMIEILCELIKRIGDETEGIKDAVINTFEYIWFENGTENQFFSTLVKVYKLLNMKEPIIQLFKIAITKGDSYKARIAKISDLASDQLYASSILSNSIVYAKILEILSYVDPAITSQHISTLYLFLTPKYNSAEESELLSSLCVIIEKTTSQMTGQFSQRIQKIETQLLTLVYTQGSGVLASALAALCAIVKDVTHNESLLTQLMKNCFILVSSQRRSKKLDPNILPSLNRAMLVLGLCIKYYNADIYNELQLEQGKQFSESIFDYFKYYCRSEAEGLRERALECLSYAWVRFPHLLQKSENLINDAWKKAVTPETKIRLLNMFQEFLSHCDLKTIEGGDEDHGTLFIAIQGYVGYILTLAKDLDIEVRENAADILKLIHLQGHVNPTIYLPTLFALLADDSIYIRETSFKCIETIFSKNSDIVLINLQPSLQESYDFQINTFKGTRSFTSQSESLYNRLYMLIKDRKTHRNKFLATISKLLEPSANPEFTFYLADLLSSLSFTSSEELTIIFEHINSKLQTNAYRLMRSIKLCCKNNDELSHEELMDTLLILQLFILHYFLSNVYQVKTDEEKSDKPVTKNSDEFPSFSELYEKLWKYHILEKASGEELKNLKKLMKESMDLHSASTDNISSRKRVRKSEEGEKEEYKRNEAEGYY
ncbi:unnamed protein product [Blepharisma stoltei]|uniref:Sister chromatid cohesion protein n=1 Tax=Blepharisma stoltei TaxID=1481888 RepID=A0AAU9JCV5_9CILI|nr:unnamed protein product [Blepharisma stoltei]